MTRVALKDLAPGQVLAAPVASPTGVVLVQAGAELTASIIARLADLGVASVVVAGSSLTASEVASRTAEVEARFAGHERDAWMMRLKLIVLRQLGATGVGNGDA